MLRAPASPERYAKLAVGMQAATYALKFLEDHFARNPDQTFLVPGSSPTIADLLLLPELDQMMPEAFSALDFSPYPRVVAWITALKAAISSYDEVAKPLLEVAAGLKAAAAAAAAPAPAP